MKRGLKASRRSTRPRSNSVVAEYSPMKRGLKGRGCFDNHGFRRGRCRVFPDEEGTESYPRLPGTIGSPEVVAEYSPMKRGLKVFTRLRNGKRSLRLQSIPR